MADNSEPGTWWGFDRGNPKGDYSQRTPLHHQLVKEMNQRIAELVKQPTHEERVERCELMGLVFCNCKLDNGQVIVYNPSCPVHQHFCKL